MRRIENRKQKRKQIWMGILLASVMVFSIFGIMVGNTNSGMRYGDYKFDQKEDRKFYTEISEGKYVGFRYLPQDLENITLPPEAISLIRDAQVLVMTFNPNNDKTWVLGYLETIEIELVRELGDKYAVKAVTEASETYAVFPILTCANATLTQPAIYFEIAQNQTEITVEGNCIIMKSDDSGFYVLKDRLMYGYFGVI